MASALGKKLLIKEGQRVLLVNEPDAYRRQLDPLPDGATIASKGTSGFDVVHLFVMSIVELERDADAARHALKDGGVFWISYPKRSSKVETDITRDKGWDALTKASWRPVAQVSIDDTWSALRFRPVADVKVRT